ncbi:MAG: hypothetical protein MJZ74_01865 [Muribaculaceae bacterium]|nr:hypothetical protein [Muribaculaceae bacterium]
MKKKISLFFVVSLLLSFTSCEDKEPTVFDHEYIMNTPVRSVMSLYSVSGAIWREQGHYSGFTSYASIKCANKKAYISIPESFNNIYCPVPIETTMPLKSLDNGVGVFKNNCGGFNVNEGFLFCETTISGAGSAPDGSLIYKSYLFSLPLYSQLFYGNDYKNTKETYCTFDLPNAHDGKGDNGDKFLSEICVYNLKLDPNTTVSLKFQGHINEMRANGWYADYGPTTSSVLVLDGNEWKQLPDYTISIEKYSIVFNTRTYYLSFTLNSTDSKIPFYSTGPLRDR